MPNPEEDTGPPFADLIGVIKEARRHRSAFQKLPLRRERLRQLYTLLDHLFFLIAPDPDEEKPLPDGRSHMPVDDLLLTKLAGPDFDLLRSRFQHPTEPENDGDGRIDNIERQNATIQAFYDLWTSPKRLKAMGFDASTIDMLNTKNTPNQRAETLHDLINREIDLLDPYPWKLANGLQHDDGLMWANVLDLNDRISTAYSKLPNLSSVRNDIAPNTKKMESEQRIIDRSAVRIDRATGAAQSLYRSLLKEVASINRGAFAYYGAANEFDQLRGPAQSQEGAIVLTACIVAARKKRGGRLEYEQDPDLFRTVLRHVRR